MQDEISWMANQSAEESDAKERYEYFLRPEPRDNMSEIYYEDDPYLGRAKCRDLKIGMVRNAKEENKQVVKAYLEPFPHARIDAAKPLQGWYQSMVNESQQSRPRPCFSEAVLTSPYSGYCAIGCQFCVLAGELVNTPNGLVPIEQLVVGDTVWGRDAEGPVAAEVRGTSHLKKFSWVVVHMSSGKAIRVTPDHKLYSLDRLDWVPAGKFATRERLEYGAETHLPGSWAGDAETAGDMLGKGGTAVRSRGFVTSGITAVLRVESVEEEVEVCDIETSTGNFYLNGILAKNCYVNSGMRGYRGTGLITVPLDYGKQIGKQLKSVRRAAAGYFSSFTDPFTPLEQYYHNTEEGAREFVKVGLPIFFLSRLRYPDWAVDLLTENEHSYAQKSINTSDPEDWRRLSPGAISLHDHLEDIARIKARGIYVSIQVNPIVPGITSNEQIVCLFKMLKEAGADHVIVKFVEAAYSWAPAMVARMKKVFGQERGEAFEKLFCQNIGAERTIDEDYRIRGHRLYSTYARKYGLSYATCYEYKYERDESGKILSKTGVSIGREFTTASQCHGHAVPVYTRDTAEQQFRPVEECPPSGCLYCASENDGKPRCGDELAGQAVAMKYADMKQPIGKGVPRDLVQLAVKR